jgi:hypothetical protein
LIRIVQPTGGGGGLTIGTTTITSGTTTRLLFDAAGVVSETDGATWSATNKALTVGGATVTTSNPVLDLSQTWNAGAVTFAGLRFTLTNTASAAHSRYLDLRAAGAATPAFAVLKDGFFGSIEDGYPGFAINVGQYGMDFRRYNSDQSAWISEDGMFQANSGGQFSFSNSATAARYNTDTFITRKAAASLRLGVADAAAPVAQTLGVQSVIAGTSNTAGVNWTLAGSQGTGTGAGGSIIFQTAPAGSTGSAQNALAAVLTLDSTKQADFAGHMQMTEMTAPAAGAANTVRLYAEDNGAGKTRLMALFASGAAQQVAIEP